MATTDDPTAAEALAQFIDEQVAAQLDAVRLEIELMGLEPREQSAALALISPFVRTATVRALMAGMRRSQ